MVQCWSGCQIANNGLVKATTVLQNGVDDDVLDTFQMHDNFEHATQAVLEQRTDHAISRDRKALARRVAGMQQAAPASGSREEASLHDAQRELSQMRSTQGVNWEGRQVPRGIQARVALQLLPEGVRPYWIGSNTCIAQHAARPGEACGYTRDIAVCHLCSAPVCGWHCLPIGYSALVQRRQRLGAGHVRCTETDSSDDRVAYLKRVLQQ